MGLEPLISRIKLSTLPSVPQLFLLKIQKYFLESNKSVEVVVVVVFAIVRAQMAE